MIWLRGKLYAILLGIGAALAGFLYLKGRKDANEGHEVDELQRYQATRKEIDQVVRDTDQSDALDFLRERASRK